MFVDTSAIVAIVSDEEDAGEFLKSLENASFPITSALVVLEAAMRLTTKLRTDPGTALREIEALLNESRVAIIPIEAAGRSQLLHLQNSARGAAIPRS